jgi:hypothetical protein
VKTMRVCQVCRGTGRVELTGAYAETLAALRAQRVPISGAALARAFPGDVSPEAMCNRLVALKRHGLAECRQNGREKLWTATPAVMCTKRKGR